MSTASDIEEYILRTGSGDRAAFSSLYSATSAKLFGVCMRILDNRAEAEDALQEVFVKIWQKAKSYADHGSSPMTWLITLARNLCIDRLRAHKTTAVTSAAEVGGQAGQRPASDHAQIETFLIALDVDEAASVRGAYLEGHSYQDLAARAELPIDTMRTRLRRSLVKLNDGLSG